MEASHTGTGNMGETMDIMETRHSQDNVETLEIVDTLETGDTVNSLETGETVSQNVFTSKISVCKFFLEGRCRFGEECYNRHQGNPEKRPEKKKGKKVKKDEEGRWEGKLPRMKTACEVISRLQWDPSLPQEYFTVGYLDRFLGVVEEPFTAFSWEDLASVDDFEVLAVPQHRIQYFLYRGEKVWDKATRLDLVFGSTGDSKGITSVMEEIDWRLVEKQREEREEEEEREESHDEEDEEEEEVEVQVKWEEDRVEEFLLAEQERSTHFLCIRVTHPDIINGICEVQKCIMSCEGILEECCMKTSLLHITLCMLRLEGQEGITQAIDMVTKLENTVKELLKDTNKASLDVSGLNNFGQRVVYAEVKPRSMETLDTLVTEINKAVKEAGAGVKTTNSFQFVPHVTVAKVSRPVARIRNSKYIPTSYYCQYMDTMFGCQVLDNIHLCVIDQQLGRDGFYTTLAKIQL